MFPNSELTLLFLSLSKVTTNTSGGKNSFLAGTFGGYSEGNRIF
jgi:hypothetical protein